MTRLRTLLVAVGILIVAPSCVWADSNIKFNSCNPSVTTGTGTITIAASGTYSLDSCATLKSVTLYAVLSCGGPGQEIACDTCNGGWGEKSVTISGLSTGSYTVNVYVRLYVTVGCEDQYYDTETISRMVSVCGCE
ncbi:MAG TPA: hypothetical protein VEL76_24195 [Gemmataceae bacterium]|nr:hypothetical protein [Gemmataceae bacterium]